MLYLDKIRLFKKWTNLKIKIHCMLKSDVYFNQRDIWWASLGVNVGHEEDGKNHNFERPVLILKKFNQDLFLMAPLSSQIKEHNNYYHKIFIFQQYNSVMLFQIKTMSVKRLVRKTGRLDHEQFREIIKKINDFW